MLAPVPKLIGSASLVHELALSVRMFDAEEAQPPPAWSCVACCTVIPSSREEHCHCHHVCEVVLRMSPAAVVWTRRFMAHASTIGAFFFARSVVDEHIFFAELFDAMTT